MKKIAILQSNYIPWKGYFDLINMVDEFILYDDVQYTKNDWRNRNKILTPQGVKWLTIPVRHEKSSQCINETKTIDQRWRKKHWMSLSQTYAKAPFFKDYNELFKSIYLNNNEVYLSEINFKFIASINNILGIDTKIKWSSDFDRVDGKTERLLSICKACKATEYLSGPSAQGYLDETLFQQENINVKWMNYSNYPEYAQLYKKSEQAVTILDLIFNEGANAKCFMKSFLGR